MATQRLHPAQAFTFTEDRLAELRQVVPEAFADGKINWDTLREVLGEHVEDDTQEHYGLSWPGKREARRLAAQRSKGTLEPVPGEGVNEETTQNVFIEGENLEVLKLLQKSYAGRIKMIYIDPPYNTGNDFIYSDNFAEPLESYLRRTGQADEEGLLTSNPRTGGRYHTNWLNMMYPRLVLARALLSNNGVIFVSIDDNEIHNLRQIMDEIFGPENFVTTVIWQKVFSPKNTAKHFSEDHDYIVVYARSAETWRPNLLPRSQDAIDRYTNPDDDPRGPWSSSDLTARNYYSEGQYEVKSPSGKTFRPSVGTYWRIAKKKFERWDEEGRIWWGESGNNMPRLKRYLSDVKEGVVPQTLWKYQEVGHTQEAKKELVGHVDFTYTENVLNSVKPSRLIDRILQIATEPEAGDMVLDFFAGSGSTAHAVMRRNAEDRGNRTFIVVQIPEPLPKPEPQLRSIADIAKQRIRRFIARRKKQVSEEMDLQRGSTAEDLGFRVFRLTQSNFNQWEQYEGVDFLQLQAAFDAFESPLVAGWRKSDLLVEILLTEGFPLHSRVNEHNNFSQNKVYLVEANFHEHRLWICLEESLAESTIHKLDKSMADNDVFVCLDSALTDEAKLRLGDSITLHTI
jgi:adenine-specific DNA-methyltransferase